MTVVVLATEFAQSDARHPMPGLLFLVGSKGEQSRSADAMNPVDFRVGQFTHVFDPFGSGFMYRPCRSQISFIKQVPFSPSGLRVVPLRVERQNDGERLVGPQQ